MKKLICVLLALVMLLSLAACGEEKTQKEEHGTEPTPTTPVSDDGIFYFGSETGKQKLKAAPNPLDPAQVYSRIDFHEKLLYGRFVAEDQQAYTAEAVYETLTYSATHGFSTAEENLCTEPMSTLPVSVEMGPSACHYGRKLRGDYEWATLGLLNERGYKVDVLCTYTVSGNTVSFTPLAAYEEKMDENMVLQQILYTVGENSLEYTFEVAGTSLKLTRDGQTMDMKTWYFSEDNSGSISFAGYLAEGSAAFANMDHFSCTWAEDFTSIYLTTLQDELYSASLHNACAALNENGQLSFYWETEDEAGNIQEHLEHLIYYPGDGQSVALTDGETVYYYTESYTSREAVAIGEGMTQQEREQLQTLSDNEIQQIAQKKADLLEDLAKAYEEAGLNVSINTRTGEIALDSTVLFGVDESVISQEGQAFLQKFTQIYTSVVYSDKYADFVSRILVEGHTDTSGDYAHNQVLSQERADSVKTYCQSEECGVDAAHREAFSQSLEAVGYACDKPVYDENGEVDMDASRRVSFRFIVRLTAAD
ncbi:MAG: OmpA family protein [Ruminococcaceae bacterium]|nr:OmpA family protein [Oscillospiraceae bacterium]